MLNHQMGPSAMLTRVGHSPLPSIQVRGQLPLHVHRELPFVRRRAGWLQAAWLAGRHGHGKVFVHAGCDGACRAEETASGSPVLSCSLGCGLPLLCASGWVARAGPVTRGITESEHIIINRGLPSSPAQAAANHTLAVQWDVILIWYLRRQGIDALLGHRRCAGGKALPTTTCNAKETSIGTQAYQAWHERAGLD